MSWTDAITRAQRFATHAALLDSAHRHAAASLRPGVHVGLRLVLAIEAAELVEVADQVRAELADEATRED